MIVAVPPGYSIAWLTGAVTCGLDAVAAGRVLLMIVYLLVDREWFTALAQPIPAGGA